MGLTRKTITCVILISFVSTGYAFWVYHRSSFLFLKVELSSTVQGKAQIYFDLDTGLSEKNSDSTRIYEGDFLHPYYFSLTNRKIHNLRFDPIDRPGKIKIKSVSIFNKPRSYIKKIDLNKLQPQNQIKSRFIENGTVIFETDKDAKDPMLQIKINYPIYNTYALLSAVTSWLLLFFVMSLTIFAASRLGGQRRLLFFWKSIRTPVIATILVVGSTLFAALLGEVLFRVTEKWLQPEKGHPVKLLDYADTWRKSGFGPGGYLKENFNEYVNDGYGGLVLWQNNSQGFRNSKEFDKNGKPTVLRILSMGDSFTAGYRVGQTDTFSSKLEKWSNEKIAPTEVLVSSIQAPSQGFTYLRKFGVSWNPDLVVLGITIGNDIAQDYISRDPHVHGFRRGLEKYELPDSTLKLKKPKIIEPDTGLAKMIKTHSIIYSRVTQLFSTVGYAPIPWYGSTKKPKMFDAIHGLGFFIKDAPKPVNEAFNRHFEVLLDYQRFLAAHNIEFAVLLFPQRFQVQPKDWAATVDRYSLNASAFDLMLPNRKIIKFCVKSGITCIDATSKMAVDHQETGIDFYFPDGDMHWNREGHEYWLNGAKPELAVVIRRAKQRKHSSL